MSSQNLLIVFVQNARIGQVKQRLAEHVGNENALKVHIHVLNHLASIAEDVKSHKAVFYSGPIEEMDEFIVPVFRKYAQYGSDYGDKLMNAFLKSFAMGYTRVCWIGCDCAELETDLLNEAFEKLESNDMVLGPASDGSAYLIGMSRFIRDVFNRKEWNSSNELLDMLIDIKKNNISYSMLPTLSNINEVKDLGEMKSLIE